MDQGLGLAHARRGGRVIGQQGPAVAQHRALYPVLCDLHVGKEPGRECMCVHVRRVTSLCSSNDHNMVNQQYFNKAFLKMERRKTQRCLHCGAGAGDNKGLSGALKTLKAEGPC